MSLHLSKCQIVGNLMHWLIFNSFHAECNTVTSVQILCKFTYIKRMCVVCFFQKMLWVDKIKNMVNIRTESPIDTNFSVQSGVFPILMNQKNVF